MKKTCKDCLIEKPLSGFYKGQGDCKECFKARVRAREARLRGDPTWVESERARGRDKYHRLDYGSKPRPKNDGVEKFNKKFPEKRKAYIISQRIECPEGFHNHHWSYKHPKDVIQISMKNHYKAHRFMRYDQSEQKFRTMDGILLETREQHEDYIEKILKL